MNNYAPIFIITLNRFEHFKRCVESLAFCEFADKTILYIALDYPANESHWTGYKKIEAFIPQIIGFKKIITIKRDENYGIQKNFFECEKEVFKHYDRYIFSEDDNVFSTNFLEYMNDGLEKFRDEDKILTICGYNYPVKMPDSKEQDIYFFKGYSGWGYGTWKHKWEKIDWDISNLQKWLKDEGNIKKLNQVACNLYPFLKRTVDIGIPIGDAIVVYNIIKNNMYSVFPFISKVRNYGHDGSGEHCGYSTIYSDQKIDNGKKDMVFDIEIKEDKFINKLLRNHFSTGLIARIIRRIKKYKGESKLSRTP